MDKQQRREKKKEARERSQRKGPAGTFHVHTKYGRYHCPFPNCKGTFIKEEGKSNCCDRHRAFVEDLVFALNHLKATPVQEKPDETAAGPKILVPKPGMEKQAIEEAKRASAGRPPYRTGP